jgi:hypothetical protein
MGIPPNSLSPEKEEHVQFPILDTKKATVERPLSIGPLTMISASGKSGGHDL